MATSGIPHARIVPWASWMLLCGACGAPVDPAASSTTRTSGSEESSGSNETTTALEEDSTSAPETSSAASGAEGTSTSSTTGGVAPPDASGSDDVGTGALTSTSSVGSTSAGSSSEEGGDTTTETDESEGTSDTETGGTDRCDVGVFDPNRPPQTLALTGNLGAHDPVIIAAHGRYYYFSTGDGIAAKTSPDLLQWTQQPEVFPSTPTWFNRQVPDYQPRNIWAPDISYFGGQYHLYYSVSSFGDNRSCIGHATRPALDQGAWTDHEDVVCSNLPGTNHNWNAIDPNIVFDEDGTPWMSLGSFWDGIKMIELDLQGNQVGSEVYDIASRGGGSIEAPFIVRRCGYYYLFVSFGSCCQGTDSTYTIHVGRSENVLGPYVDRDGRAMLDGGGTLLVEGGGSWVGPGHNAVLIDEDRAYNIYHAYAATNGFAQLRISELFWDDEGWPITTGP